MSTWCIGISPEVGAGRSHVKMMFRVKRMSWEWLQFFARKLSCGEFCGHAPGGRSSMNRKTWKLFDPFRMFCWMEKTVVSTMSSCCSRVAGY